MSFKLERAEVKPKVKRKTTRMAGLRVTRVGWEGGFLIHPWIVGTCWDSCWNICLEAEMDVLVTNFQRFVRFSTVSFGSLQWFASIIHQFLILGEVHSFGIFVGASSSKSATAPGWGGPGPKKGKPKAESSS